MKMNLLVAVSNLEGQPIDKKYERRRVMFETSRPAELNELEMDMSGGESCNKTSQPAELN